LATHGIPDHRAPDGASSSTELRHAPDDVLLAIGARKDEWSEHLRKALKENPRYKDLFPEDEAPIDAAPEETAKSETQKEK
jgi:hypothetical protein